MEEHKLTLFQRLNKVFSSEDYINSNNVANTTNTTSSEYKTTTMPDLKNKTVAEAKEILISNFLKY